MGTQAWELLLGRVGKLEEADKLMMVLLSSMFGPFLN